MCIFFTISIVINSITIIIPQASQKHPFSVRIYNANDVWLCDVYVYINVLSSIRGCSSIYYVALPFFLSLFFSLTIVVTAKNFDSFHVFFSFAYKFYMFNKFILKYSSSYIVFIVYIDIF